MDNPDDAAVWRLDDRRLLVVTTDFFAPVVDDPYDYGAIAAANSLSDAYAMGAQPFLALTIAALPATLEIAISQQIMRGLAEKTAEAGAVIAGGHTIKDEEPKIGLVVLGFADPETLLRKDALQVGDRLVLTKPLGIGVITTAIKQGKAAPEEIADVVAWMSRLNRDAADLAAHFHLRAATDVTGFSFLGHASEMAASSKVGMQLNFAQFPLIVSAKKHAEAGRFPGGAFDNRSHYQPHVVFDPAIPEAHQMLLFDPQTSGGLLLGVPERQLDALLTEAEARQTPAWVVGEVTEGDQIVVAR